MLRVLLHPSARTGGKPLALPCAPQEQQALRALFRLLPEAWRAFEAHAQGAPPPPDRLAWLAAALEWGPACPRLVADDWARALQSARPRRAQPRRPACAA
jgi:hypothetical protein